AEQEGQQTETEATGAPQKHHYTLNQQVGSITPHYSSWIRYKYLSWENDFYYSLSFKTTGMTPIAADKRIRGWRH
ncbi:hypothetical protein, partial [Klebsiella pneumoniae]|uniref:hypothetical protein n=1 Tax=Klebsiella pneumoniae TaxID=573 RepID=UPI001C6FC4A0